MAKLNRQTTDAEIAKLVNHMVVQTMHDSGPWGGNRTDGVYMVAAMTPFDQELFLFKYLRALRTELETMFRDANMSDGFDAKQAFDEFANFNSRFAGGFHCGQEK